MLSLLISEALAHGSSYNTTRLSVVGDPLNGAGHAWAVVDGWGLIHSGDGENWEWVCEESLGVTASYDVLAWEAGAVVATSGGLLWLEGGCAASPIGGLPDAAPVTLLQQQGDRFLAAATGAEQAGLWDCGLEGCRETGLVGAAPARRFVRSMVADRGVEGRVWASVLREEDMAAEVWRAEAGGAWERVAGAGGTGWGAGSDARVLLADGDRLLVWEQPRSDAAIPALLRSADGGRSFVRGFELGSYQDPIPTLVEIGGRTFLSSWLGRTWCAEDGGGEFREVSQEAPLLRCGAEAAGRTWVCADHFADGYDIGIADGGGFSPMACLDQVALGTCQQQACGELYFAFSTYGGSTAGVCGQEPEDTGAEEARACGCGGRDSGAGLLVPGLIGAGLIRGRSRRRTG